MPAPIEFRSDNAAGVCPEVLAAIAAANLGSAPGYGADELTAQLRDRVREVFQHREAEVFPVVSGTAANAVGLSALCPPWGSVLCHESAHINVHECGATSLLSGGAVLRPLPGPHGQIDPAALEQAFAQTWWDDPHQSQPAVLSLVCPSDLGTVTAPKLLGTLTGMARTRGLRTHLDGARLANAVITLDCTPAEVTWRAGFDVVSFGATKNGGMSADAIISFDAKASDELRYRLKRAGHVPSKLRFQSSQLLAVLTDDLWLRLAARANAATARLTSGLRGMGLSPLEQPDVNMVFLALDAATVTALAHAGLLFHELTPGTVRLVTSWQTTDAEVDDALDRFATVLGRR